MNIEKNMLTSNCPFLTVSGFNDGWIGIWNGSSLLWFELWIEFSWFGAYHPQWQGVYALIPLLQIMNRYSPIFQNILYTNKILVEPMINIIREEGIFLWRNKRNIPILLMFSLS